MSQSFDIAIIGAGIVGLAAAFKILKKAPSIRICVIEKEREVALHQSSHNSGVIHSGIYYKPGSQKALNCRQGYLELLEFVDKYQIPHDICGKVIVATREQERPLLHNILKRGIKNGLEGIKLIDREELKEKEPYVNGLEAIWVPQSGIIDYKDVALKYAELITKAGGSIFTNNKVQSIKTQAGEAIITTNQQELRASLAINCAGLYADKIGHMVQADEPLKILPFRGEYYELIEEKEYFVNNLIYPVPNPNFPFLGVHYTRMIKGGIEAGPNAVLAFKQEGYSRWDFNANELFETLVYPGFRKIASKYRKTGLDEMHRSFSKRAFVKALQHLIPEVEEKDLKRGRSGVRAQAVKKDGNLVDDFYITQTPNVINVWNAPSPAATASLAIGGTIAEKALKYTFFDKH